MTDKKRNLAPVRDEYGQSVVGYEHVLGSDDAYVVLIDDPKSSGLVVDAFLVRVPLGPTDAEDAIRKVLDFIDLKVKTEGASRPYIKGVRVMRVGYRLKARVAEILDCYEGCVQCEKHGGGRESETPGGGTSPSGVSPSPPQAPYCGKCGDFGHFDADHAVPKRKEAKT